MRPTRERPEFKRAVTVPEEKDFEGDEFVWIERCGIENLKGRIATADLLAKEAATTLTILLAGTGSAGAYAVKLLTDLLTGETTAVATVAVAAASIWLGALAGGLVIGCLMLTSIPALYNQPGLLLQRKQAGETYEQWRRGELDNIEARIQRAIQRNRKVARRLNWIRALAALTPVIAVIAGGAVYLARGGGPAAHTAGLSLSASTVWHFPVSPYL